MNSENTALAGEASRRLLEPLIVGSLEPGLRDWQMALDIYDPGFGELYSAHMASNLPTMPKAHITDTRSL